jgi:hypothetical protein
MTKGGCSNNIAIDQWQRATGWQSMAMAMGQQDQYQRSSSLSFLILIALALVEMADHIGNANEMNR